MEPARQPTSWGPAALVATGLAGPVWTSYLGPQQLLVGRIMLVLLAAGIAVDLVPVRGRVRRPAWAVGLLAATLAAFLAWVALNAFAWGCDCGSNVQSLGETVVLVTLAGIVGLYAPRTWIAGALGAGAVGVLIGGLLAVVGARDLHSLAYTPSASASRLEGVYGNPNFLGLALALGLPAAAVGVVALRDRLRWICAVGALALAAMLVATFSRGGLVAGAIGVVLAVWVALRGRPSRRLALAGVVAVAAAMTALIFSPFYRDKRVEADFGSAKVALARNGDLSAWVTTKIGPIHRSGAQVSRAAGNAVTVRTRRPSQGVIYDLGAAFGTSQAGWRFTVTAHPAARVRYEMYQHDGTLVTDASVMANDTPQQARSMFPAALGTSYAFVVVIDRATRVEIAQPALYERRPHRVGGWRSLPVARTAIPAASLDAAETDYQRSRVKALRLALSAFGSEPLRGIGFNEFGGYANARAKYGLLPTHDTYAQVLAELGAVGVAALLAVVAALGLALQRTTLSRGLGAAVIGTLATGAVGLLFLNGLGVTGMEVPLALAMGFAAALVAERPPWLRYPRAKASKAGLRTPASDISPLSTSSPAGRGGKS